MAKSEGVITTYRLLAETFEKLGYGKIAEKVKEMEGNNGGVHSTE